MPTTEIPAAEVGEGLGILDLLVRTGLAPSKSEARRLVTQGGIAVDDNKVINPSAVITLEKEIIIKKGKKVYHKVKAV
jgi:tyrosyl-tRNA synthetase